MLEILHNNSGYQTVREKVDSSKDHFKDRVMRLPGDKDLERVLDIVCKRNQIARNHGRGRVEVPGRHVLHASSTCDALFVIGGVMLRLIVLIGSPVIPNRLPNRTSRIFKPRRC